MMYSTYEKFLDRKTQFDGDSGFEPTFLPDFLFDFQKYAVDWAARKGRAGLFFDCGLGKGPMQLVWAENVIRKTNGRVLILTPLAVSHQLVREGEKFGIECARSADGKPAGKITITNYERLHLFDSMDYVGLVCDESSILKSLKGVTRLLITTFAMKMQYRLLCTATAAPNDYWELGTSSEALGYLGHQDMITRFFKEETKKDFLGWGRKTYRFRGHAEEQFWRWVCSWARVCRKPSDLGFDDGGFKLPPLIEREHVVKSKVARAGMLFAVPANDLVEQREERRITIEDRCEAAASYAGNHEGSSIIWCHLNDEGDVLAKMMPDAVQVAGSMPDEKKEERLLAFAAGQIGKLIIKPKIGCLGLNLQNCHNVITFASHSFEAYYQSVRRCYRFGQKHPVTVTVVTSEGEVRVLKNLQRKAAQANRMFESLSKHANDALKIERTTYGNKKASVPSWL